MNDSIPSDSIPTIIASLIKDIVGSSADQGASGSFSISPPIGGLAVFVSNPSRAQEAANKLAKIGSPAVPALTGLLDHRNPAIRDIAADTLMRIGAASAPAEQKLLSLLADTNVDVRISGAWALAKVCPNAFGSVVEAMLPLLQHSDWVVRGRAATILALVGKVAEPAIPMLEKMLDDRQEVVADRARQALAAIRKPK